MIRRRRLRSAVTVADKVMSESELVPIPVKDLREDSFIEVLRHIDDATLRLMAFSS